LLLCKETHRLRCAPLWVTWGNGCDCIGVLGWLLCLVLCYAGARVTSGTLAPAHIQKRTTNND
jgi:hypothetical protein